MKRLFKKITPAICTIAITAISLTSCASPTSDGLVAIPSLYLNINGTELNGLKPGDDGENKDLVKLGYSKLTVPKSINIVSISATYDQIGIGYKAITKIDYEDSSVWDTMPDYGISGLTELTTIVLPPKLINVGEDAIIIPSEGKLSIIDISNVENTSCLTTKQWIKFVAHGGQIILRLRNDQTSYIDGIKDNNTTVENWTIEYK